MPTMWFFPKEMPAPSLDWVQETRDTAGNIKVCLTLQIIDLQRCSYLIFNAMNNLRFWVYGISGGTRMPAPEAVPRRLIDECITQQL